MKMPEELQSHPVGYQWLVEKYDLRVMSARTRTYLRSGGRRVTREIDGQRTEYYPPHYDPGSNLGEQMEFALKHEGVDLAVLLGVFRKADPLELAHFVEKRPTGIYTRRIWFFYEFLTGKRLECPEPKVGAYVYALDPLRYFTAAGVRSPRHRVINNLPGTRDLCCLTRRTKSLVQRIAEHWDEQCRQILKPYDPTLVARAVDYLYTKETKSSYAIEHEAASASRAERFVALLRRAAQGLFDTKPLLIELQNAIVDPRFAAADYRDEQSYVGESTIRGELVHYVCPKPEDVASLMHGLVRSWGSMTKSGMHPVLVAASVAFGFVFIHPFEDGNGRIHRFLIHNILAAGEFTPDDIIFPVSASMLRQRRDYDRVLELVSRPLNSIIDYSLDDDGRMTVSGETSDYYRYIDMTPIAEQLFAFIEDTVKVDLVEELSFLNSMDRAASAIREIADIPDRLLHLFIKLCRQNHGRLSLAKRQSHFAILTDGEIDRMERAVEAAFGSVE